MEPFTLLDRLYYKGRPYSTLLSVCRLSVTSWYRFETAQHGELKFNRMVGQGLGSYGAEGHAKRFLSSGGYSGGTLRFASTEIG